MSKLLKVIVNTLLLLAILSAGALVIPPFAGITTLVSDGMGNTNISRGAVTYAKKTNTSDVAAGDKILVDDNSGKYIYTIQSIDSTAGTASVKNVISGDTTDITVKATVSKVIVTIPVIGFLSMAAQSREGIMIIGLAILFLIILFILSEVWKRDEEADEEEEDEDDEEEESEELRSRKKAALEEEKRQEEQDMAEQLRAAEQETAETEKTEPVSAAETEEGQDEFKIRDFEAENSEPASFNTVDLQRLVKGEEAEPAEETETVEETAEETEETEIIEEADEIPEETAEESEGLEETEPAEETETAQAAEEPETIEETEEPEEPEEAEEPEPEPEPDEPIELAMPVYTAEELIQKAHAAGDDPKVIEDPTTGITILDYSDIL